MKKFLIFSLMGLMGLANGYAQDDVYFVPTKKKKDTKKSLVVNNISTTGDVFVANDWADNRVGDRDVDEYNRMSKSAEAKEPVVVVEDYDDAEAYDYTTRIVRFHAPSVGICVSSPFYWDCYYYDFWYNYNWYTGWHSPYYYHNVAWYSPYYSWAWHAPYRPYYNNYWAYHRPPYDSWGYRPAPRPGGPAPGIRPGTNSNGDKLRPNRGPVRPNDITARPNSRPNSRPNANSSATVRPNNANSRPSSNTNARPSSSRNSSNVSSRPSGRSSSVERSSSSPSRSSSVSRSSSGRSGSSGGGVRSSSRGR